MCLVCASYSPRRLLSTSWTMETYHFTQAEEVIVCAYCGFPVACSIYSARVVKSTDLNSLSCPQQDQLSKEFLIFFGDLIHVPLLHGLQHGYTRGHVFFRYPSVAYLPINLLSTAIRVELLHETILARVQTCFINWFHSENMQSTFYKALERARMPNSLKPFLSWILKGPKTGLIGISRSARCRECVFLSC